MLNHRIDENKFLVFMPITKVVYFDGGYKLYYPSAQA